jgi:hypothetical protein
MAADQFAQVCKADIGWRLIPGVLKDVSADISSEVRHMRLMICAALFLAGCGATMPPAVSGPVAGTSDACAASAHQDLIGRGAAASLVLPEPKRVYGPSDAVTTDFIADRLNVQLDDTDTIVAVVCG